MSYLGSAFQLVFFFHMIADPHVNGLFSVLCHPPGTIKVLFTRRLSQESIRLLVFALRMDSSKGQVFPSGAQPRKYDDERANRLTFSFLFLSGGHEETREPPSRFSCEVKTVSSHNEDLKRKPSQENMAG